MIETGLQAMIQLWEQRNCDVHGKSEMEQKQRLLERQRAVISALLSKQHRCLPEDHFLFPNDPNELLNKTSTVELGNWILTRKAAILRSERMAQEQAIFNTNPIYTYGLNQKYSKHSARPNNGAGINCCLSHIIKRKSTSRSPNHHIHSIRNPSSPTSLCSNKNNSCPIPPTWSCFPLRMPPA